jgi:hypothetical protein
MKIDQILREEYSFILALLGEEVTPRRKSASALPLLAIRNALHTFLKDGKIDDFTELKMDNRR